MGTFWWDYNIIAKKRFSKINIEISNVCNLKCSFCPEVIRPKALMRPDLFLKVIEQVAPLTEMVCLHLMGEPLLHPNLGELVDICARFDVKVFLVTNGVLLKDSIHEILLNPIFHQISFSLHSFFDNFSDRDPAEYLDRVFKFTDKAILERPDLYLNFRLWNLQTPSAQQTRNLEILEKIETHYSFLRPTEVDVRKRKSFKIKNRMYLHFDTEFRWPNLGDDFLGGGGRCLGLSSHFGILADGTVVPCCLDKEAAINLGSLRDQTIIDILNSPRVTKIREGFQSNKLIEELCQKCNYATRFTKNRKSETISRSAFSSIS